MDAGVDSSREFDVDVFPSEQVNSVEAWRSTLPVVLEGQGEDAFAQQVGRDAPVPLRCVCVKPKMESRL